MPVVIIETEFSDGATRRVAVRVDPVRPVHALVAALRRRLRLGPATPVDLRGPSGAPVPSWDSPVAALCPGLAAGATDSDPAAESAESSVSAFGAASFFALVSAKQRPAAAPKNATSEPAVQPAVGAGSHDALAARCAALVADVEAAAAGAAAPPADSPPSEDGGGRVMRFGPKGDAGTAAAAAAEADDEEARDIDADARASVRLFGAAVGPSAAAAARRAAGSTGDSATSHNSASFPAPGVALHVPIKNGKPWRAFTKGAAAVGTVLAAEPAALAPAYPRQLVELMRAHPALRCAAAPVDPPPASSSLAGVPDEDFAKHLAVALALARRVRAAGEAGAQCAFYPQLQSVRHSCRPASAAEVRHGGADPTGRYLQRVRVVAPAGLGRGDEVSVLYPRADVGEFMLLPAARARALLRRWYFFDCDCPERCRRVRLCDDDNATTVPPPAGGTPADAPPVTPAQLLSRGPRPSAADLTGCGPAALDATTTGAFFEGQDPAHKAALAKRLHDSFAVLDITAPESDASLLAATASLLKTDSARVSQFIADHSSRDAPLRLHRHHWRLSMARLAFMRHVEAQLRLAGGGAAVLAPGWASAAPTAEAEAEAAARKAAKANAAVGDAPGAGRLHSAGKAGDVSGALGALGGAADRAAADIVIEQMATEAALMPPAHPHAVRSFRLFRRLVARLPGRAAGIVQRRALREVAADWAALQAADARLP